jgi:hypothetical protein
MKGAQLLTLATSSVMKLFGAVYPFAIAVLKVLKRWIGGMWRCSAVMGYKVAGGSRLVRWFGGRGS